eukprot:gene11825-13049_t
MDTAVEDSQEITQLSKERNDLDDDGLNEHDDFMVGIEIPSNKEDERICGMKPERARIIFGVVLVLLIAISNVGAVQFANRTYTPSFSAPYFTTWYTTCFTIIVFPLFIIPQLCKKKPWRFRSFIRESSTILGPQGICLISLVKYILPFCLLWLAANYLYIRALKALNPADVTALFSSVSAFVYLLSLVILKEKFFITRLTAVLLSIGGIVLFASRYGFKGPTLVGVILSVFAAAGSALYQVLFKRSLGFANSSQVALFLSLLGLCSTCAFWIILLPLHFSGFEVLNLTDMPWRSLNASGFLVLIFNFLLNFGIAFTTPLFIALGMMLATPLNALADYVFSGAEFGPYKIVAAILILTGFLLMLIPNDKLTRFENKLMCAKHVDSPPVQNENDAE